MKTYHPYLLMSIMRSHFFEYLTIKNIKAYAPRDAIYKTKRCYRDRNGEITIDSDALDMEIIVKSSPKEIEPVLAEWISTI